MKMILILILVLVVLFINHYIETGNDDNIYTEERWDEYEEEIHML